MEEREGGSREGDSGSRCTPQLLLPPCLSSEQSLGGSMRPAYYFT